MNEMCMQHFASIANIADTEVTNYGGAVVLADYCPYVQVAVFDSSCILNCI